MIKVLWANGTTVDIMQVKMDGTARIVHAGFVCLLAAETGAFEVIRFPIFDESATGAVECETHIGVDAFLPKMLHPFKMARARTVIVFPSQRTCSIWPVAR